MGEDLSRRTFLTQGVPFKVGSPCLQAPGETTMGVAWTVPGLSKGAVEIADNPEMRNPRLFRPGGLGLVPIDDCALSVRITGLRPSTRYWYRTVTTPFLAYENAYSARLGADVKSGVFSFMTLGEKAPAHFCMMSDTHARWKSFQMIVNKVKELNPVALVWNGDATNTTQDKATAAEIFLDPPVADRDYAADIPTFFESGNHDFRGSWISKKEEVMFARHPAERRGDQWDLKWNFAVRCGDLALIGMDTGEDKPDGHPKGFGLANFSPYRKAQAAWLEKALSRPDIASAKFKVVFCHIPLFDPRPDANPGDLTPADVDPQYKKDYAAWQRTCQRLWGASLVRAGVDIVISGHQHCYRYDPPAADRPWAQLVAGGCDFGVHPTWIDGELVQIPDDTRFPTVIEGGVKDGKLVVKVHDLHHQRIAGEYVFRGK